MSREMNYTNWPRPGSCHSWSWWWGHPNQTPWAESRVQVDTLRENEGTLTGKGNRCWTGKPQISISNSIPLHNGTLEPQKLACERQSYIPSKLHIQWYHVSMKSPSWKCLHHGNRQVLHIRAFISPEVVTHLLTHHCPIPKYPIVIIPALPHLTAPIA